MEKSFLFYDFETSGLSVCHDQPIQVAAVRVNHQLNTISETEFKVRPRPDVVWSLPAMRITGLTPSAVADGESEYHAALRLHRLFTEPGTISIGFNSFGFDDRVARFLFYRNLCDPYLHQYANGCGRADVLAMLPYFVLFAETSSRFHGGRTGVRPLRWLRLPRPMASRRLGPTTHWRMFR